MRESQPCCWGGCFGTLVLGSGFVCVFGAAFGKGFFAGAPVLGTTALDCAIGAFFGSGFVCGLTGVFFTAVGPDFGAAFGTCLGGIVLVVLYGSQSTACSSSRKLEMGKTVAL